MSSKKTQQVGPRHLVIPDCQVKPGVPTDHLVWAAKYAAIKKPDVIVNLGDFYDLPSLSSWDKGKLASHGKYLQDDLDAGEAGLKLFHDTLKKHAPKGYKPRLHVVKGNHEIRLYRHVESNPELNKSFGDHSFAFKKYGWTEHDFLDPVEINNVTYCHFFPLSANGRVTNSRNGAPSALAQVRRMMRNCVAGHAQGLDTASIQTPGRIIRGIIAGSYYIHSEKYIPKIGDTYWKGLLLLNDLRPESGFDLCEVSMDYLRRRFG